MQANTNGEMALWMDAGSEPKTESEIADLEAIAALKESAAIELKVFPISLTVSYFILEFRQAPARQ